MTHTSLIKKLNDYIRQEYPRIVSINEVYRIADSMNRKRSNAERRLRPSESPRIQTIKHAKKGYIIGYRWIPYDRLF